MLEGEIGQIKLIERLVELWREQFTGAIRFENDGIIKIVYFKGGDILSASTNDRADSIDEILMRAGKVSREHVKQALARRKENETLGDALLNLGFITRKELTWARRVQVVGVIRSIAAWTEGSFTIVADYLPKRDEGTLFPLPQVLVELIVTEQDRGRFEKALDGGNAVFTKTGDFDEVWRRLGLNEDAEAIANEIDGDKNATEVATASGRDTFNVYKLLDALATLGVLARAPKPRVEPQFSLDDFASAGVADAADMWKSEAAPEPVMATPQFELDDSEPMTFDSGPTVEIPAMSFDEPEAAAPVEAEPVLAPSYDEEETMAPDEPYAEPEPVATSRMPAWETPPPAAAVPIPVPVPPAAEPADPQWGFDEAQIETARRASVPVAAIPSVAPSVAARRPDVKPPKRERSRFGLLLALMLIAILAGAGYFGFQWWQGTQEPETVVVAQRPRPRIAPRPAETGTVVDAPVPTATSTSTAPLTDTSISTMTTTVAPNVVVPAPATTTVATATTPAAAPAVPKPMTVSPEPPASQPLPAVTARRDGSRARYDAMAREFAANATGNFTVQVQILCEPSNLDKVLRAGGDNVWFVPQTIGARSCYRVFWGRYNTREEAQRALAAVPSSVRDPNSAVKPVPKR